MAFVTPSKEVRTRSFTDIENKFITKYMPVLDPMSVKVYIYLVYICKNAPGYTMEDLCRELKIDEKECEDHLKNLEEYELISIVGSSPCEVVINEAENVYGTPKKIKPEKYSNFTKNAQNILKGRMIDVGEYQEYFNLIEEGFDENALLMVITYCVQLKGDDIRKQYILKVAHNFESDGINTVEKVEDKLRGYSGSTASLQKIFSAAGIRRKPEVGDSKLYKKWSEEMGFSDEAIICAAKWFKTKSIERLDAAMDELYRTKKFDVKEIEAYCRDKTSIVSLTIEIAKNLGIYVQNTAPYIENYVNVWTDMGYSPEALETVSRYCFKAARNSFEDMSSFVTELYESGIVSDGNVEDFIKGRMDDEKVIKEILSLCGLTRKIIAQDRENLKIWREWGFSDAMVKEAAKISAGKLNPIPYMSSILSSWKKEGVMSPQDISHSSPASSSDSQRAEIERHYHNLRSAAEEKAEKAQSDAMGDEVYAGLKRQINALSIDIAFTELQDAQKANEMAAEIADLEKKADARLREIGIDKSSFTPHYACPICNDTGYDSKGMPCECLKKFLASR